MGKKKSKRGEMGIGGDALGFRARTAVADGTAAKRRQRQENFEAAGGWIRGSVSGAANTVNKSRAGGNDRKKKYVVSSRGRR